MAIGINWAEVWAPVWKPVWATTVDEEQTAGIGNWKWQRTSADRRRVIEVRGSRYLAPKGYTEPVEKKVKRVAKTVAQENKGQSSDDVQDAFIEALNAFDIAWRDQYLSVLKLEFERLVQSMDLRIRRENEALLLLIIAEMM